MTTTSSEKAVLSPNPSTLTLKQPKAFALAIIILVVFGGMVAIQKNPLTFAKPDATPAPSEKPQATTSDKDFLEQMIPHHQEAVDVSRYLLENSDNDALKQFAQKIVDQQSKEIWTMLGFYQLWFNTSYPGSSKYMKMMPDLTQLSGQEMDKAYVRGMIDHHQEAVKLSQAANANTKIPELSTFATEISIKQVDELKVLTEWINKNP